MIGRARIALLWVALTTLGFAVATLTSGLLTGAIARPLAGFAAGVPYILVFGGVAGIVIGLVQLPALPRRTVRPVSWMVATLVGAAVGFVLAAFAGELLGNVIDPLTPLVVGEGAIEDTSGLLLGLAIAFAQWRVLRGTPLGTRWWIAAGAIGAALGYGSAAAVLELLEIEVLRANLVPAFGGIVGLFVGGSQAIVLIRTGRSEVEH